MKTDLQRHSGRTVAGGIAGDSSTARPPRAVESTVFAGSGFCRIWAETFGLGWEPLENRDELGLLFDRSRKLGIRDYSLAPRGLYWSADGPDGVETTLRALGQILSRRSRGLTWNVRYDRRDQLDTLLRELGPTRCRVVESFTHVIEIADRSFDEVLGRVVKPVTRRKIRLAADRGVEVRPITTAQELRAHAALCAGWAAGRDVGRHPPALFERLIRELPGACRLLGAFADGALVSSVLIFHDSKEWIYWHGVRDPERDELHAMNALLAATLQEACHARALWFNLGASSGLRSLEFFKERWGAERRTVWSLRWQDRLWSGLLAGWRRIRRDA